MPRPRPEASRPGGFIWGRLRLAFDHRDGLHARRQLGYRRDFNAAIGDLIVLNLIDADGNAGNGDTAFSFIGTADNPFTAAGQVSWAIGGRTDILFNTDGDAEADGVIRVFGAQAVDASWFVL